MCYKHVSHLLAHYPNNHGATSLSHYLQIASSVSHYRSAMLALKWKGQQAKKTTVDARSTSASVLKGHSQCPKVDAKIVLRRSTSPRILPTPTAKRWSRHASRKVRRENNGIESRAGRGSNGKGREEEEVKENQRKLQQKTIATTTTTTTTTTKKHFN